MFYKFSQNLINKLIMKLSDPLLKRVMQSLCSDMVGKDLPNMKET